MLQYGSRVCSADGVTAGNYAEKWTIFSCRCLRKWRKRVKRVSVNDVSSLCSRLGISVADQLHHDQATPCRIQVSGRSVDNDVGIWPEIANGLADGCMALGKHRENSTRAELGSQGWHPAQIIL